MRFMVWLCLLHVSHLVCGAAPSSQITRAATGAGGAPNRRHLARPQGVRGLTPTRRATTPVIAWSSTRGLARAARRARQPGRPPLGYSLRRLTGSYRYPDKKPHSTADFTLPQERLRENDHHHRLPKRQANAGSRRIFPLREVFCTPAKRLL